jgi:type VI protein secretion system component VasF
MTCPARPNDSAFRFALYFDSIQNAYRANSPENRQNYASFVLCFVLDETLADKALSREANER